MFAGKVPAPAVAAPDVSTSRAPHVLLIHPGALGDLVIARPAFVALRRALPAARLTLAVGDDLASFAAAALPVDAVLPFDAAAVYGPGRAGRTRAFAALVRAARAGRPTHAAVFKPAVAWAALARASGARVRVGLARGAGARLLTTALLDWPRVHHHDRYRAVAAALARQAGLPALDELSAAHAADWPPAPVPVELTRRAGRVLVGIAPGGARNAKNDTAAKRWPAARYAALARALLAERPDLDVVLFGAASDAADAAPLRAAVPPDRLVDLVGQTTVLEARAAVAHCSAFVCNDTALLHLAATTDTPTVAIFGPTDPRVLAPRRAGVTAVWEPACPAPCWDEWTGRLRECAGAGGCCIARPSVERVAERVRAALGAPVAPVAPVAGR